jgi:hypothetical protein
MRINKETVKNVACGALILGLVLLVHSMDYVDKVAG